MDVKSEMDFKQYYENEYYATIDKYYDNTRNKRNSMIIIRLVLLIVITILSVLVFDVFNVKETIELFGSYNAMLISYFCVLLVGFLLVTYRALKKEIGTISEFIIRDIFTFIGDKNPSKPVDYRPNVRISDSSVNEMELFNLKALKSTGKNYALIQYNKKNMCFSDLNLYILEKTNSTRIIYKDGKKYIRRYSKRRNIFDGIYIGAPLNKNNTNHIYLIPNNFSDTFMQSKIMNFIEYKGVPVMLENLEFSKKYKVFCDDEVQARYILSLSLMEKINELDELFKEKKYIVFKEGKRFAICIEGVKLQDIRDIKLPIFRNKEKEIQVLTSMFIKINNLFKIYHILDLGNELYTKNV